jgi:selenium metabolism protein YedF
MDTTIVVNQETMGQGDPQLGRQLMLKCLHQLTGLAQKPHTIVFYNGGVRLLASDSPTVDVLRQLERDGVELIACGTCVEFYHLRESISVGHVCDMREIVTRLMASDKVITI